MVMACLTISWALILLNKYKVVIHATSRVEFTPLLSTKPDKNTHRHDSNFNTFWFHQGMFILTEFAKSNITTCCQWSIYCNRNCYITCKRLFIFQDVLNQIVNKLHTGFFGWFVWCVFFRLQKLKQVTQCYIKSTRLIQLSWDKLATQNTFLTFWRSCSNQS